MKPVLVTCDRRVHGAVSMSNRINIKVLSVIAQLF